MVRLADKPLDGLLRRLRKEEQVLAKSRDRIRAILNQAEALENISDDAVNSIDYAIDRLSEQV
jgi:hypothetical protein